MFIKRLLSGIVLVLVSLVTIIYGGNVLLTTIGVISLIGQFELYRTIKMEKSILAMGGYVSTIAFYIFLALKLQHSALLFITGSLMILMIIYVISYPRFRFQQLAMTFIGFLYVSVMLSYIYLVRNTELGMITVWLTFIAAWGSDTCAYCVGVLFGKHKLPSTLSPKKTIEGSIGGIVGAMLLGFLYAFLFKKELEMLQHPEIIFALISGAGALISQIGDLVASGIKRDYNEKDYGNIIPGHGGVLDRFDSIIFTAPVIYFLVIIF